MCSLPGETIYKDCIVETSTEYIHVSFFTRGDITYMDTDYLPMKRRNGDNVYTKDTFTSKYGPWERVLDNDIKIIFSALFWMINSDGSGIAKAKRLYLKLTDHQKKLLENTFGSATIAEFRACRCSHDMSLCGSYEANAVA